MNKLSSALGAVAVIAICVVFILQFRPASGAGRTDTGPQCAVEVRGTCISQTQFKAAKRLIAVNASPERLRSMGFGQKVADGLLESWLLNQDAKRLGISVSEDDVSTEIHDGRAHVSLPVSSMAQIGQTFQIGPDMTRMIPVKSPKTKKFDVKYAEKQIRYFSMLSPSDFRDYQRSELVAARMRDIVRSRVRVSESEAKDQFDREKSTVTLEYVRFDRRFFADLLVDGSQKAADTWAELHKEEVDKAWDARKSQVMPECRAVRQIFVRADDLMSDADKTKALARMDRIKERIAKGEDFAAVARAQSDDGSAVRGGEIGCLLKGASPKPLEDATLALKPGQVSPVVTTENGLWLIKLDQVAKDAEAEKLGRAWTARELFLGQEAEKLAVEGSRAVAAAVKGGKPLKDALEAYMTELRAKTAAVEDKKAKKDDKKAEKKDKDGKAEEKKAGDEPDHPALTVDNHPNRPIVETTLPFNISGSPIPGVPESVDLTKIAFGLQKPGDAPPDAIPYANGYVAIALKEKTAPSKEQWAKDKELYLGQLRAVKAQDALVAYIKRLHGQLAADVKFVNVEDKAPPKGTENAPPPMDDDGE